MGIKKINLLNPSNEKIKEIIKQHEEDWGYGDKVLYMRCVEDMKKVNLYKIQQKDISGPIRVFLINWGMMSRWLERKKNKGRWEKDLLQIFPKICDTLQRFRNLKLEEKDMSLFQEDIKKCYNIIRKVIAPTSASKVLHLIAPNFFPMWDSKIRTNMKRLCKKLNSPKINDSPEGYYNFMIEIQNFLKKYNQTLSELNKKYDKKSKLRIIDAFMWKVTRK